MSNEMAEIKKDISKLNEGQARIEEKLSAHNAAHEKHLSDLKEYLREKFEGYGKILDLKADKTEVENVAEKTEETRKNLRNIALAVIFAVITALLNLVFT